MLTAEVLRAVGCTRPETWLSVLHNPMARFEITGARRVSSFLAHVGHESGGFARLVESLNYRAERLMQVWPRRFPRIEDARAYAQSPRALANLVYGSRLGNIQPDDGWRYRGRGLMQVTGRANYEAMRDYLQDACVGCPDFVTDPDAVAEPRWAAWTAAAYWDSRDLNALADAGEHKKITQRINGGLHGFDDREARRIRALTALTRTA